MEPELPIANVVSRRAFLATGAAVAGVTPLGQSAEPAPPRQASGVKVGEVTDSSAIIWTRLTAQAMRNSTGRKIEGRMVREDVPLPDAEVRQLLGACPGAAGRVRVRHGPHADLAGAKTTDWIEVREQNDFTHSFALQGLPADTLIHYAVDTKSLNDESHSSQQGSFRTAVKPGADTEITFAVVTCQMYADLDHPDGFHIYPAIARLDPRFVVFTGDNVYYDSERPRALTPAMARYHWERMYSLPRHVELLRNFATYWEKDDHDTLKDDSWAGQKMGELTFEEGQRIFRQQVPMGESIFRTFRWGKHLQIWLTDGRDFRSPNTMKDGPEKTIWGKEQKAWLFRTMQASDARWKVIISPTPLVGPDRGNKGDNHANRAFQHEGDEVRNWLKEHVGERGFTVCGDRHWQYHSVHPVSGLHEFSVGAASDQHAGGTPGENKQYHRFHRVKGGFLTVTAKANSVICRHHDVHGQVVYEYQRNA